MGKLVFLGGTCGNNNWRRPFMLNLASRGVNPEVLFNPVVTNWDEEAQKNEEEAKKKASHLLFYLGNPKQDNNQLSTYSMVEATMALYDKLNKTVIVFDPTEITGNSLKSYKQTEKVLRERFPKANIFSSLEDATEWLVKELI